MYHGIINVYKEAGYTSHDVVAKLRGICKQKKIGHTGTLDPDAVGVLPVCLGCATRLCDMLTDKDKEYVAVLRLGITTDTQDATGKVLAEKEVSVSEEEVRAVIASFEGEQLQIPPMYSALKVNGKKLYELAREGKEIKREARPVHFFAIEIKEMQLPFVRFSVTCSKGTYIRTLCQDIGEKLGCGACMQSLIRTRVDRFVLAEAKKLAEIEQYRDEGRLLELVVPVDAVFEMYPAVYVQPDAAKLLDNGNPLYPKQTDMSEKLRNKLVDGQKFRVYNAQKMFCGVYNYREQEKRLKPEKIFYVPQNTADAQSKPV